MAARQQRLIAAGAILVAALGLSFTDVRAIAADALQAAKPADGTERAAVPRITPKRIISLVPALTEMLFAIGAGPQVIGVSSFDTFPPEVERLPRVGALLNPDVERILSLRPDLVITYGSQSELETQVGRAGIRTFSYRHGGIDTVLGSIRDLGRATGRTAEGERVAGDLKNRLDAVRTAVKNRPRPRVLLVFERQANTLQNLYASGGVGFLNEMLDAAGGTNVFADVARESVQPSHETLLSKAPDVIIEIEAVGLLADTGARDGRGPWAALASVPAVRTGRIHRLTGEYLVMPGPRLAQATEAFARVLHPEAFR